MTHSLDGVRGRPQDERWTVDIGLLDCSGRGRARISDTRRYLGDERYGSDNLATIRWMGETGNPPDHRVRLDHSASPTRERLTRHTVKCEIDEAFKELEEHQDLEKALDKVAELQEKVIEAREKGEITSQARARAINDALDELAAALEADV
jgi:hypothetical protein